MTSASTTSTMPSSHHTTFPPAAHHAPARMTLIAKRRRSGPARAPGGSRRPPPPDRRCSQCIRLRHQLFITNDTAHDRRLDLQLLSSIADNQSDHMSLPIFDEPPSTSSADRKQEAPPSELNDGPPVPATPAALDPQRLKLQAAARSPRPPHLTASAAGRLIGLKSQVHHKSLVQQPDHGLEGSRAPDPNQPGPL